MRKPDRFTFQHLGYTVTCLISSCVLPTRDDPGCGPEVEILNVQIVGKGEVRPVPDSLITQELHELFTDAAVAEAALQGVGK